MANNLIDILQQKILTDIPLTQHMGLTVSYYDGQTLQIKASLEKNINHRQTAFGGSISAVATLAVWGWLYLKLYEQNIPARIVVQQSSTDYLQPITSDFVAICKNEDPANFDKFINTLTRKGVARIKLTSQVLCETVTAAEFSGDFVAKLSAP